VSSLSIFQRTHPTLLIRTPRPIIDGQDRIIAALAGQPNDPGWDGVAGDAAEDIRVAGEACNFTAKQARHRRGPFSALAEGVLFGGGQQVIVALLPPYCRFANASRLGCR
jgi:hypothetical protein